MLIWFIVNWLEIIIDGEFWIGRGEFECIVFIVFLMMINIELYFVVNVLFSIVFLVDIVVVVNFLFVKCWVKVRFMVFDMFMMGEFFGWWFNMFNSLSKFIFNLMFVVIF